MPKKEPRPKAKHFKGYNLPYPAKQAEMTPPPDSDLSNYQRARKLKNKAALITGADSSIGRAVAVAFAPEGARVAILYNVNDSDCKHHQILKKEEEQENARQIPRDGTLLHSAMNRAL